MYPEVLFPEVAKIYIDTHEEHSRFFLPEIVKVRNNYSWQTKNVNLSTGSTDLENFIILLKLSKIKTLIEKSGSCSSPRAFSQPGN